MPYWYYCKYLYNDNDKRAESGENLFVKPVPKFNYQNQFYTSGIVLPYSLLLLQFQNFILLRRKRQLGYTPRAFWCHDQKMLHLSTASYGFAYSVRFFHDYFRAIVHVTAIRLREWTFRRRRDTRAKREREREKDIGVSIVPRSSAVSELLAYSRNSDSTRALLWFNAPSVERIYFLTFPRISVADVAIVKFRRVGNIACRIISNVT